MKNLLIKRPLVFLGVESTGVDPRHDRIIELGLVRLEPGRKATAKEFRFYPGFAIPPHATAAHGIRDEHVAHCPAFCEKATAVAGVIGAADLAGFGIVNAGLPLLLAEFERAGRPLSLRGRKVIDTQALFHLVEPRNLCAAVRRYCGRKHRSARRIVQGVIAAANVLDGMLEEHEGLPRGVPDLHALLAPVDAAGWFRREKNVIAFARGRHRGVPLRDVANRDPAYLAWLRRHALPDAKQIIELAMGSEAASQSGIGD